MNSIQFAGLLISFSLCVSIFSVADGQEIGNYGGPSEPNPLPVSENELYDIEKNHESSVFTHYKLSLSEDLDFRTDDKRSTDQHEGEFTLEKKINMKEKLSILSGGLADGIILKINASPDRLTVLDRIYQKERSRFELSHVEKNFEDGPFPNIKQNEPDLQPKNLPINSESLSYEIEKPNLISIGKIFGGTHIDESQIFLFKLTGAESINEFDNLYDSFKINFLVFGGIILVFVIPIGSFVILGSKKKSWKFYKFDRIFSLLFITILIGSIFSVPYSSSLSMWGTALGEKEEKKYGIEKDLEKNELFDKLKSKIKNLSESKSRFKGDKNYEILSTDLPKKIDSLTVSAWVKPNYTKGSSEYSVLSKERAFILDINKDKDPKYVAKFSIFDGMQWHTIESRSKIREQWTHLAATFDNSSIKLYVNGELDSALSDIETLTLSHKGHIVRSLLKSISSESEINVGAYTFVKKDELKVKNQFTGSIEEIKVLAESLAPSKIKELFYSSLKLNEPASQTTSKSVPQLIENKVETFPVKNQESENEKKINEVLDVEEFDDSIVIISSSTTNTKALEANKDQQEIEEFHEVNLISSSKTATRNQNSKMEIFETLKLDDFVETKITNTTNQKNLQKFERDRLEIGNSEILEKESEIDDECDEQEVDNCITICHVPPGNSKNSQTISIGERAVDFHLQNHHGDHLGKCHEKDNSPTAPNLINAEVLNENSIKLTWVHDQTPKGGYDVIIDGKDTNNEWRTKELMQIITGLEENTEYCFEIQARYVDENKFLESNTVCVITQKDQKGTTCQNNVLNLTNLSHGTREFAINNDSELNKNGITVSAKAFNNRPNEVIIFDADKSRTPDEDLEVGNGLHLVIIPENVKDQNPKDGLVDKPNDSSKGGIQTYEFDPPRTVNSFVFVDADRAEIIGWATAYDSKGNVAKFVSIPEKGDASVQTIIMNAPNTSKLEIEYMDSGGVTNLDLQCVTKLNLKEILSIGDTIETTKSAEKLQILTESVAIGDTIKTTKSAGKLQILTESVAIGDTIKTTKSAGKLQILSESMIITDSVGSGKSTLVLIIESIRIEKTATTKHGVLQIIKESLGLEDKVLPESGKVMPLSELLSLKGTNTSKQGILILKETLNLDDNTKALKVRSQILKESLQLKDTIIPALGKLQNLSESLKLVNVNTLGLGKLQQLPETLEFDDPVTSGIDRLQSLTESLELDDTTTFGIGILQTLTESIELVDSASPERGRLQILRESMKIEDNTISGIGKLQTLKESFTLDDIVISGLGRLETITESLELGDTTRSTMGRSQILKESIQLEDIMTQGIGRLQFLSESLKLESNVTPSVGILQKLKESLELEHNTILGIGKLQTLTESMELEDIIIPAMGKLQKITEALKLNDSTTPSMSKLQKLSEFLELVDVTTFGVGRLQILKESLELNDTTTPGMGRLQTLKESLELNDTTTPGMGRLQTLKESLELNDTTTPGMGRLQSLTESLELNNTTIIGIGKLQQLSESLELVDVREINTPPVLDPIGNKIIDELNQLTFRATAMDAQSLPQILTFSLSGAPLGSSINPNSGVFTWIPTEQQGPGTFTFSVIVSDGSLFDSETITVKVNEVAGPVIPPTRMGGSGSGGGGGGGSVGNRVGGFGGNLTQPVILYEIFYDVCDQNLIRVIAGNQGESYPPSVKIRGTTGITIARLIENQPYTEFNKVSPLNKFVYEAPIPSKEKFFIVIVEEINGRQPTQVSHSVNIHECTETIIVSQINDFLDKKASQKFDAELPQIFDVSYQMGSNATLIMAGTPRQFVDGNETIEVSGLITSPTKLVRAELRTNSVGQPLSEYAAVKMNIQPIKGTSNAYAVSGKLPSNFLNSPAINYWIHVLNEKELVQDSKRYFLGVKPNIPLDITLKMDSLPNKPQGKAFSPTASVLTDLKIPVFGSVSLLVDNEIVFTSPEQVFDSNNTQVSLNWVIPKLGLDISKQEKLEEIQPPTKPEKIGFFEMIGKSLLVVAKSLGLLPEDEPEDTQTKNNLKHKTKFQELKEIAKSHTISAILHAYDAEIKTEPTKLYSYPAKVSFPILNPIKLDYILNEHGNVTAKPTLIYSSSHDKIEANFRVTLNDDDCFIGQNESCFIQSSTVGNNDNVKRMDLNGQIYRIKYSGPDNSIERFTITSADSVVGEWKISLETGNDTKLLDSEKVDVKIGYKSANGKLITTSSKKN